MFILVYCTNLDILFCRRNANGKKVYHLQEMMNKFKFREKYSTINKHLNSFNIYKVKFCRSMTMRKVGNQLTNSSINNSTAPVF